MGSNASLYIRYATNKTVTLLWELKQQAPLTPDVYSVRPQSSTKLTLAASLARRRTLLLVTFKHLMFGQAADICKCGQSMRCSPFFLTHACMSWVELYCSVRRKVSRLGCQLLPKLVDPVNKYLSPSSRRHSEHVCKHGSVVASKPSLTIQK